MATDKYPHAVWTEPGGCGTCQSCHMDMDMEPWCGRRQVAELAEAAVGRAFPCGVNIRGAREVCLGNFYQHRERRLRLADAVATEALGAQLAQALLPLPGLVVYLHGYLGSGKTTLVRGWLRAMGAAGPVRSPTYTLVEPYELGGRSVLHLDLYRLSDPTELEQLGLYDTPPERSFWLVEWPERGAGELPPPDLEITLRVIDSGREVAIRPTPALAPLLSRLDNQMSATTMRRAGEPS